MGDSLLKRRVAERLDALKINAFEAARAVELGRDFVNDILNGKKTSVRGQNLLKLAEALKCTPDYLINEKAAPPDDVPEEELPERDERADLIQIPEYDVRLSAGAGFILDRENVKDVWSFSRRYLVDEMRLRPAALAVVEVEGDSMYPTLWSGDRVIIDHTDTNPAKPGVYAIWDSDATVVKRLERVPASDPPMVVLISDNKNHNQYTVPADLVRVIGRVVWYARRL